MLLAFAQLTLINRGVMPPPQFEEVVDVVDVDYTPPEPEVEEVVDVVPEPVYKSNLAPPTSLEEYQSMVKQFAMPELVVNHQELALALISYRGKDYITHVSEDQLSQYGTDGFEVMSYIRTPKQSDPNFWYIFIINTAYGHIYLSTALDESGGIPENTAGVFITFDTDSTSAVLNGAIAEHPERFQKEAYTYSATLQNLSELQFLLGNDEYQHSVGKYM